MLALAFGVLAGAAKLQGLVVVIAFCAALHLLSSLYTNKVLKANDEDYPNMELYMEGAGNSFGMFLLSWILVYSFV